MYFSFAHGCQAWEWESELPHADLGLVCPVTKKLAKATKSKILDTGNKPMGNKRLYSSVYHKRKLECMKSGMNKEEAAKVAREAAREAARA